MNKKKISKKEKKKKKQVTEQDSMWKEIVETYFPQLMEFFFNKIYQEIDFSRGYSFLDKELEKVVRDSEIGKRFADKLIKIYLKEEKELWLLLHLEVQGKEEENFARRIYIYNYRIFDRYNKDVVSLAILTDDNKNFRPDRYEMKRWGTNVTFEFLMIKLLDYKGREEELERDSNPFALVVLCYLKLFGMKKKEAAGLYSLKLSIARFIIESGKYSKEDALNLLRFLDWLVILSEDLAIKFNEEIVKIEEAGKMPYVTSFERVGYKKGLEEGIEKGIEKGKKERNKEISKKLLEDGLNVEAVAKYTELSIEEIRKLINKK